MRNVDLTPYNGEILVAYWRIQNGRMVGILFGNQDHVYRYRIDNGGGYIAIPMVDILLGDPSQLAINSTSQKIVENYKSAKLFLGAPVNLKIQ